MIRNKTTNEQGMVSIVVTIILMLVISITVLSFAQIIRREQRQALDSQLSSQAFYAAESGINDARTYIKEHYLSKGLVPDDKKACADAGDPNYPPSAIPMTVDGADTTYPCLLITGNPKSLVYDVSPSASSRVIPIDTHGTPIKTIDLSWQSPSQSDPIANCPATVSPDLPKADLPPTNPAAWKCGFGMIRIDLVPGENMTRNGLMASTFTAFLTPVKQPGTNSISYIGGDNIYTGGTANQSARPAAFCNTDGASAPTCKITIKDLSASKYYARVSALYAEVKGFTVAANDFSAKPSNLYGAQVVIDSTGKANDVLRRIQVRVPLVSDTLHADYGIQSKDSLCKQYQTYPSSAYSHTTSFCTN
ncbi:MAG: hypothetical protein JWN82_630 [Candidatus Saccharibacteria bacterium]|nr:hypothetical protein [Candidatus Saccharibacteria bacterium]